MIKKFLKRYIDLPALTYLLREKKITLLDPHSWDDSNDSHYLLVYKKRKGLKSLLALCFTKEKETYNHWRVFAGGSSGVCIRFKRAELVEVLGKHSAVRTDEVEYLKLDEIQNRKPTTEQLPFIKRYAFEDESEFRVIFESTKYDLPKKDIPIPLSCIARISLSPWTHKSLIKHVKEVLSSIDGCVDIEIVRSTLVSNEEWKRIGGSVA